MKRGRLVRTIRFWFWTLLIAGYAVAATGVMIDTLSPGYRELSQVAVTTVQSPQEVRMSSASQTAAVYRALSGAPFSSLPPGSTFTIVWPDGSSEQIKVVSQTSPAGTEPVVGTQQLAPEADQR